MRQVLIERGALKRLHVRGEVGEPVTSVLRTLATVIEEHADGKMVFDVALACHIDDPETGDVADEHWEASAYIAVCSGCCTHDICGGGTIAASAVRRWSR